MSTRNALDAQAHGSAEPEKTHTSPPLALVVMRPGSSDHRLPPPIIDEASGGQLDLGAFEGDAHTTATPWPLIAEGQRLWLAAYGTATDGSPLNAAIHVGIRVDQEMMTSGAKGLIPRTWLDRLKGRSELRLEAKVDFAGDDEATAVVFPETRYEMSIARLVETFEGYRLGPPSTAPIPGPPTGYWNSLMHVVTYDKSAEIAENGSGVGFRGHYLRKFVDSSKRLRVEFRFGKIQPPDNFPYPPTLCRRVRFACRPTFSKSALVVMGAGFRTIPPEEYTFIVNPPFIEITSISTSLIFTCEISLPENSGDVLEIDNIEFFPEEE